MSRAEKARVLYTTLYRDPDDRRRGEFLSCLERNQALNVFTRMIVFLDTSQGTWDLPRAPSTEVIEIRERPTYRMLFEHANQTFPPGSRLVIANGDIYFDTSIRRAFRLLRRGRMLAISRRDVTEQGAVMGLKRWWSQDAWMVVLPVRPFDADFQLGLGGCDNRLAFEAARAGLELRNPALSVAVNHLHARPTRHAPIYKGEYLFVPLEFM